MENLPTFEEFINENYLVTEGSIRPGDAELVKDFVNALHKQFGALTYHFNMGKDEKTYDYARGYVYVHNAFTIRTWNWCNPKFAEVLINCGFFEPVIEASYKYVEVIGGDRPSEPKPAEVDLYVKGYGYNTNYRLRQEIEDPTKVNFDKIIKTFLKNAQKETSKEIAPDVLKNIFSNWKKTQFKTQEIHKRHIGIGRHASDKVLNAFEASYDINGLETIFGDDRKKAEDYISKHYMFQRGKLHFDWDNGIMYVNGTWVDTLD